MNVIPIQVDQLFLGNYTSRCREEKGGMVFTDLQ